MLIVSEKRYVPTAVNMMVLQGDDGLYYYMHRSLYDECVILHDQYANLLPSFYKLLGFETEHPKVCDTFMELVPEPIDILAPFLGLITGCEQLETVEDMCGALSSMSMSIDFRKMFKVPSSVRQSIKFSLSVREEYRVQWDRFFMETPEFDQVQFSLSRSAAATVQESVPEPESGESYDITYVGGDVPSVEDIMAQLDSMSGSALAEESEPAEQVSEKATSGYNLLRRL